MTARRAFYETKSRAIRWLGKRRLVPWGLSLWTDLYRLKAFRGIENPCIVDVGACIGEWTSAALSAFPHAIIYAFEPSPGNFSRLQRRFAHRTNVNLFELALSSNSGYAEFYIFPDNRKNSLSPKPWRSLVQNAQEEQPLEVRTVKVETLDQICTREAIDRIDLLKIDVEGNEIDVLMGCANVLSRRAVEYIYAEFTLYQDRLTRMDRIIDFLGAYGYIVSAIYTTGLQGKKLSYGNILLCGSA